MKFSSKIEKCNLSPIRKFYPYQVECAKRGVKIYHLNIGQPDIATPRRILPPCVISSFRCSNTLPPPEYPT